MKKRYVTAFAVIILLLSSLCGCASGNTLLETAAPERCDLGWYTYDGNAGNFYVMCDRTAEKSFLEALSKVSVKEAEDWSYDQLVYPIYGLQIDDGDGKCIELAWSNGYCITGDGRAYVFDYDMVKLASQYEWNGIYPFTGAYAIPCYRELCLGKEGWVAELLEPAGESRTLAPEGVSMVLTEVTEDTIHVELTNKGAEEWCFGEDYSVQVCLDGTWYNLPEVPGRWGINAIAIILPAGKTMQESYDMRRFGELPVGEYRLVKDGMLAEFEIK